jgi:hypothetical protein
MSISDGRRATVSDTSKASIIISVSYTMVETGSSSCAQQLFSPLVFGLKSAELIDRKER